QPVAGEKELQAAPAEVKLAEKARDKAANAEPTFQLKTEPQTFTVHRSPPAKKVREDVPLLDGFKTTSGAGSGAAGGAVAMDDVKQPRHRSSAAAGPSSTGKDEEMPVGQVAAA